MNRSAIFLLLVANSLFGQQPPYDVFPEAKPPYHRIRYEASKEPGKLIFPVNYTIWIPPGRKNRERSHRTPARMRGRLLQIGPNGERSIFTGKPWPRNTTAPSSALPTSNQAKPTAKCGATRGTVREKPFKKAWPISRPKAGHPELVKVPWALWGHSGGGHWAGGMALLHPERVAAAWLRSGVPLLEPNPQRPSIKPHVLKKARPPSTAHVQPRNEGRRKP